MYDVQVRLEDEIGIYEQMITPKKFWFQLIAVIVVTVIALVVLDQLLPASTALSQFTVWCVLVFTCINALAYYAGRRAVRSTSKFRFIQMMMILILFKMMICIGLVVIHVEVNHPASKLFVIPFLLIYLIFTLFEIYVLEKMARTHTQPSSTENS